MFDAIGLVILIVTTVIAYRCCCKNYHCHTRPVKAIRTISYASTASSLPGENHDVSLTSGHEGSIFTVKRGNHPILTLQSINTEVNAVSIASTRLPRLNSTVELARQAVIPRINMTSIMFVLL